MNRSTLRAPVLVVVFVVALSVALVVVALSWPAPGPGLATGRPIQYFNATLSVAAAGLPVSPAMFGVGIEADSPLTSDSAALLSATPIHYLRYPDGTAGDAMDLVNGSIYAPGEVGVTPAAVTVADFVSLCRAINCSAIIELPVEINDPGVAAYEVSYIEHTLQFFPAYWELGNEPRNWTCYGVPWVHWVSGCDVATNATEYANSAAAYISSVRQVDPSAQFLGLGGTDGSAWVTPLEAKVGPELAGISVHSYVDDLLPNSSTVNLQNFFAGLSSANALPNLIGSTRRAIIDQCGSCSTAVFVTEMDSVSFDSPLARYLDSSYNGLFFAAEMTQAFDAQATSVEPFAWTGAESGLVNESGPGWRYVIELHFLSHLGDWEHNATVSAPGVYATATTLASAASLLLVNTDSDTQVNVTLPTSGWVIGANVTESEWSAATQSMQVEPSTTFDSSVVSLPPLSVVLLQGSAASD